MKLRPYIPLLMSLTLLLAWYLPVVPARAGPDQQAPGHSPADLIAAVNQLRIENGLAALAPHPSLMEVAQWEADAIAAGAAGHTRPPGLTLGAWMISLGYPLAGNIALDGYRSENWAAGSELTVGETIQLWLGDAPHTNTMLSVYRSDIGAGVALGEDPWGNVVYYYVIETALQTSSGQMQPEAIILLTSLPETMQALYPDGTQALTGIDFSIAAGERMALVGENGAGKTTLMRILKDEKPDYFGCVFDTKAPTFRHEKYKEYKATLAFPFLRYGIIASLGLLGMALSLVQTAASRRFRLMDRGGP